MSRTLRMASGCWAARVVVGPEVGAWERPDMKGWAEAVVWNGLELLAPWVLSFVLQLLWASQILDPGRRCLQEDMTSFWLDL